MGKDDVREAEAWVIASWGRVQAIRQMLTEQPMDLPERMALDRFHQRAVLEWTRATQVLSEATVERVSG